MSDSLFLKERPCPNCEHGKISTLELPSQAECTYCHKLISLDSKWEMYIAGFFVFFIFLFVYLDVLILAGFFFALYTIYNALLHKIATSYFPLKLHDEK